MLPNNLWHLALVHISRFAIQNADKGENRVGKKEYEPRLLLLV